MDTPDNFSKRVGGEDPVIVPGNAATSLLAIKAGLPREDGDAMPPPPARARGAEAMTSVELNLVKQWIQEGANFEKGEATEATEPAAEMKQELLDWTNFEGKSLKAAFIRAEGTNVILKMENGSEIPYPYDKLSAESQELAKKLALE